VKAVHFKGILEHHSTRLSGFRRMLIVLNLELKLMLLLKLLDIVNCAIWFHNYTIHWELHSHILCWTAHWKKPCWRVIRISNADIDSSRFADALGCIDENDVTVISF